MNFKDSLINELIARFSSVIPKVAFALLVLLIGWLIAGAVRRLVSRIMATVGFDKLTEQLNEIDLVQRSGVQIKLSAVLGNMVYYVIMLGFIVFATDILGIPAITDMVRDLIDYLPALFSAFILFVIGLFLADLLRNATQTALLSMGLPSAKGISTGIFYFLLVTVTVSALSQANIQTDFIASNLTVLIGAGALAFAIGYGLAARDLVANYLASYYNKGKVHLGDDVQIDGVRGKVVMIDATSLILQTDDRAIVVPLSKLASEKVEIFYPDGQTENLLNPGDRR
ncbi:MAG: mechanosensitive ion channel [Saprospiraceae bacterium]|nr:mechanosensitive ion channel [Saprospiraceae bacterium]